MKIKYHESGNLDLELLSDEIFPEKPTTNFHDLHETSDKGPYIKFKGADKKNSLAVFLGYSEETLVGSREMEKLGEILMPNNIQEAWRINLSKRGVRKIDQEGLSIRYPGGAKLTIIRSK